MNVPFLNLKPVHDLLADEMLSIFKRIYYKNTFILGDEVIAFEKKFEEFCGVKHAIGISNGLDALCLSLKALGVKSGDEVIVPSNTFIATVLAVQFVGASPIFVEPDINTYNIDVTRIEEKITKRTKVIIPVHLYGQACNMQAIMDIANRYGIYVIEDNAQAQGASYKGGKTGSWGNINATSFYPGKNLGALGDAGAITTNDTSLFELILKLRNYGSSVKYVHDQIGYNMRIDEIQAGFLNIKLSYISEWNEQRNAIANKYVLGLANIQQLILPETASDSTHVYHLFVLRCKKRDELQAYLKEKGITTLIHYPIPPHLQQSFAYLGFSAGDFPIAEELAATSLSIPLWPMMPDDSITYVIETIKSFFYEHA
uniref:DegT/DnrJ/EryC1/StrS family aminotransferase n=1 Tax=Flavobacterium sp. TaxID=239 RepID=UPI00404920ED